VGSPLTGVDKDELVRLAKRLKKNNIAVDVVNFGEEAENTEKLEAFINAINTNDNRYDLREFIERIYMHVIT
jgi:26S proteasome regulatory subunit N10